jgi:hypothetical protein
MYLYIPTIYQLQGAGARSRRLVLDRVAPSSCAKTATRERPRAAELLRLVRHGLSALPGQAKPFAFETQPAFPDPRPQDDAEEAIRLDGGQPKYHCRRGAALLGQGHLRDAAAAFAAALALDAGYAAALEGQADVRRAAERKAEAL